MNDITPHIFLYTANLIFILTNLYGGIIKAFYKAEPYRANYDNLFPSQKANVALYLLQIFELPYLLMLPDPRALFYVNAFSILVFSSLMVVMQDGYFFLKREKKLSLVIFFAPVVVIVGYLLLAALDAVPATAATYRLLFWVISGLFLYYVARLLVVRRNIGRNIRAVDEGCYSNSADFPVHFARRIEWVPITICVLMFLCFTLNDARVKMWRDLFFTFVNVWFLLYTLNPHRRGVKQNENGEQELQEILTKPSAARYKLTEERCREIERRLTELLETEMLFLDSHLTLDQLSQKLGVNRNYVSETLSRSSHGSFYALINGYRIEYAKKLLLQNPALKLEHVALDSGFSSVNVFSQVFKRYQKIAPGAFVKGLASDIYTQN